MQARDINMFIYFFVLLTYFVQLIKFLLLLRCTYDFSKIDGINNKQMLVCARKSLWFLFL